MTIQTRREFLGKLGWMFAGGILVPYIPKTFYSIPEPVGYVTIDRIHPNVFKISQKGVSTTVFCTDELIADEQAFLRFVTDPYFFNKTYTRI